VFGFPRLSYTLFLGPHRVKTAIERATAKIKPLNDGKQVFKGTLNCSFDALWA
jgi:hypothetical protein